MDHREILKLDKLEARERYDRFAKLLAKMERDLGGAYIHDDGVDSENVMGIEGMVFDTRDYWIKMTEAAQDAAQCRVEDMGLDDEKTAELTAIIENY